MIAVIEIKERGDRDHWEVDIEVSQSYSIKEKLKELGFSFNGEISAWRTNRIFSKEDVRDIFLEQIESKLGMLGCKVEQHWSFERK